MNEEFNNSKNFCDDLLGYSADNTAGGGEQTIDRRYKWIVFNTTGKIYFNYSMKSKINYSYNFTSGIRINFSPI